MCRMIDSRMYFNPLPPHGGRHVNNYVFRFDNGFQSTPSAWRETIRPPPLQSAEWISIHSLRMEGDVNHIQCTGNVYHFNPLPPHGGRHLIAISLHTPFVISIHSLRMEGDVLLLTQWKHNVYFNPLPPHGGRPSGKLFTSPTYSISIHSLRMEGDDILILRILRTCHFNPLPPHGGRPVKIVPNSVAVENFNPLPPHGGRHGGLKTLESYMGFQSTPSAWRETYLLQFSFSVPPFQSTPSAWRETHPVP